MKDEHRARKRFGQNFLRDQGVIAQILRTVSPHADQHLVEIGPGKGAITAGLIAAGCELDVVEVDRDLVAMLQAQFGGESGPRIHSADALRFDFSALASANQPLRIVGNLPYNISTPLIFHLLNYASHIHDMHFMLQREVVNRLAAKPGGKAWGRLGVMAQFYCQVDALFEVPPEAFDPAPKVQSMIVRLQPHREALDPTADTQQLQRVVRAAFSQRRKTLRNTLRDVVSMQQLEQLGISPTARAETLDLQQFIAISKLPLPAEPQG
jgi:16S rRNA (adenine1518-N6/adenine1519-N6)-dimethyltransferase